MCGNCKTCKHWESLGTGKGVGECALIDMGSGWNDDVAYIDADASDDTGLDAKLITHNTFGCTLHNARSGRKGQQS